MRDGMCQSVEFRSGLDCSDAEPTAKSNQHPDREMWPHMHIQAQLLTYSQMRMIDQDARRLGLPPHQGPAVQSQIAKIAGIRRKYQKNLKHSQNVAEFRKISQNSATFCKCSQNFAHFRKFSFKIYKNSKI